MDNEAVAPNEREPPNQKPLKEPRVRKFSLISYCSEDQIRGVLEHRPVRGAVYILHDRDIKEDGTPKEPHVHILLSLHNAATVKQVRNWFPKEPNTLGQVLRDNEKALRYLQHLDDPEKTPYTDDEVKTFGEGREPFVRSVLSSGESAALIEEMLDDIISGVPIRMLVRRYGRDFAYNREKLCELARMIEVEEGKYSCNAQMEWLKICDLHDGGIMSEYEYLRLAEMYGEKVR